MLSATLLYRRKAAVRLTALPFSYSCVGSEALPAGPVPLMPNRLWSVTASSLWPQPDSSMACAIVTAAGTPYLRCAATAPGATARIKASCVVMSCGAAGAGTCAGRGPRCTAREDAGGPADPRCAAAEPACRRCAGLDSPGIFAAPCAAEPRAAGELPGTFAATRSAPAPAAVPREVWSGAWRPGGGCSRPCRPACASLPGLGTGAGIDGIAALPCRAGARCAGPAVAAPGIAASVTGVCARARWWRDGCSRCACARALPAGPARSPLLTNPTIPWPPSGALNLWALTEKSGSESPPIVCRTPCA